MRNTQFIILLVILAFYSAAFCGCEAGSNPTEPGVVPDGTRILIANSLGETISKFTYMNNAVTAQNDLAPTGQAPNQFLVRGNIGYIVNSLSNSILAVDLTTLDVLFEASTGAGKSPFNMDFINDDEIIVTDFVANDCVRMNIRTGFSGSNRVTATIALPSGNELPRDSGTGATKASPEAVKVVGSKAYVTLANLDSSTFVAGGPGLVAIVDLVSNQVQSTTEMQGRNTVGFATDPFYPERLYVLSAGDINPSTYVYEGNGKIDVFNLNTKGITASVAVSGAPYEMIISYNHIGYLTDGKEGKILTFDTTALAMGSPITIAQSGGMSYASGIALGPNYLLFALEFNHDELIVIDTLSGNEVIDRFTTGDGMMLL